MKKILLAVTLMSFAGSVLAEDAAPEHQVSGTATVVSDYVFRGLTQTWHQPAIQGGIDYVHASGFYASVWASTVNKKVLAGATAEVDLVAAYRGAIDKDWTYGVGIISIYYPGANWNKMRWGTRPDKRYDFSEASAFIGYKVLTFKYSLALNDVFGYSAATGFDGSTRHSNYIELNADIPVADSGVVFGLHAGRQNFKSTANGINADFNDYRVSLTKTFEDNWTASVQLSRNTNKAFFGETISNLSENDRRDIGRSRTAVTLTKAF